MTKTKFKPLPFSFEFALPIANCPLPISERNAKLLNTIEALLIQHGNLTQVINIMLKISFKMCFEGCI